MTDVKQILHLDYLAIRPYFTLKNLLIFSLLFAFYAIIFGEIQIVVNMVPILTVFYVSYPFLVADEAGLDHLYIIFGIEKKSVVRGRYLTLLCLNLVAILLALLIFVLLKVIIKEPIDWYSALWGVVVSGMASILFSCIQLPFLFKLEYKKAKQVIFMSFMGLWIILYFALDLIKKSSILRWLGNLSTWQMFLLIGFIFVMLFYFSYRLSLWSYRHKEI